MIDAAKLQTVRLGDSPGSAQERRKQERPTP